MKTWRQLAELTPAMDNRPVVITITAAATAAADAVPADVVAFHFGYILAKHTHKTYKSGPPHTTHWQKSSACSVPPFATSRHQSKICRFCQYALDAQHTHTHSHCQLAIDNIASLLIFSGKHCFGDPCPRRSAGWLIVCRSWRWRWRWRFIRSLPNILFSVCLVFFHFMKYSQVDSWAITAIPPRG